LRLFVRLAKEPRHPNKWKRVIIKNEKAYAPLISSRGAVRCGMRKKKFEPV
jgi:hypothetical protein